MDHEAYVFVCLCTTMLVLTMLHLIIIRCLFIGVCVKSIYTFHPLTSLSFINSKLLVVCGSGKSECFDLCSSEGVLDLWLG